MSLGSTIRCNADGGGFPKLTSTECAALLARKILSLRKCGIEDVWMRLNEELDSEDNASRVLCFHVDEFRAMLQILKVKQTGRYYISQLRNALEAHGITVDNRDHKKRESENYTLDPKYVRFGFYGSPKTDHDESIQPNASHERLYSFLLARDGPTNRLLADVKLAEARDSKLADSDSDDESVWEIEEEDDDLEHDSAKYKHKHVNGREECGMCESCLDGLQKERIFKCKYKNNKPCLFLKIPSGSYKHVKARIRRKDVSEVAEHLGSGDAKRGMRLLVRRLYECDPQSVTRGLQEENCHFRSGRLSTEQSLMYMGALGIGFERLKTLSALLKFHLGHDVLATHADMKMYQNPHETKAEWYSYPAKAPPIGSEDPDAHHYWEKKVLDVVTNRIRSDRDHNKACADGIPIIDRRNADAVVRNTCISVVISCDGGGGSFKVTATIALRESDHSKHLEQIGWANCAEKHDILGNGILGKINDSLLTLKGKSFLFVQVSGTPRWDFLCVPSEIRTFDMQCIAVNEVSNEVTYRYEYPTKSGKYQEQIFKKLTGNDISRGVTGYILPVKLRGVCDLKCMCMLQNRPNYSNSRCPFCELRATEWEAESVKKPTFTSADMDRWFKNSGSECNYENAGFVRGTKNVLYAIDLEDWIIPRLHEEIGLGTNIHDAILNFAITNVEQNLESKRIYFTDLGNQHIQVLDEMRAKYQDITNAPTYNAAKELHKEYKEYVQAYSVDGRNRDPSKFPSFAHGVTAAQHEQLATVEELEQLRSEYANRSAEVDSIKAKIAECGAASTPKAGKSTEKRTSKLASAVQDTFTKFGIDPQAYHGGSLVGNHSRKLFDHSEEILGCMQTLFLREIDAQFRPAAVQAQERKETRRTKGSVTAPALAQDRPEVTAERNDQYESKRQKVMSFISDMILLTSALDLLFSALSCFQPLEESDIVNVEAHAKVVGELWRKLKLGAKKPKLHILEAHAGHFLRSHNPLGFVTEEGVEKLHAQRNRIYRIFASIKNAKHKESLVVMRESKLAAVSPEIRVFNEGRKRDSSRSDASNENNKTGAATARKKRKHVKQEKLGEYHLRNASNTSMPEHAADLPSNSTGSSQASSSNI